MEDKEIELINIDKDSTKEDLKEKNVRHRKLKRKIAGGTAAGVMAAGLFVNGLFENPSDLMSSPSSMNQPAVVETIDLDVPPDDVDDKNKKAKEGTASKVRQWIQNLPVVVKAVVGVPLWVIGWALMQVFTLVFGKLLSPVLGTVLKWVLGFVILAAIFVLIMKWIFPDAKVKEILRPKNLLGLGIGVVILFAIDLLTPIFWGDFSKWRWLILIVGGLLLLVIMGFVFSGEHKKKRKEAAAV